MNKKVIVFIILALVIIVALGWYFYPKENIQSQLEKIKQEYPELASQVDDVIEWENKLKEDESIIENYLTLGLAWKSLADRTKDRQITNYKDYYQKALGVYQQGIEITNHHNALFMNNAGNMAKYLEDYELVEDYYQEAISVDPGRDVYYIALAELYEHEMNKTKDEIIAVYDEGISRIVNPGFLEKRKESYLNRINQ